MAPTVSFLTMLSSAAVVVYGYSLEVRGSDLGEKASRTWQDRESGRPRRQVITANQKRGREGIVLNSSVSQMRIV